MQLELAMIVRDAEASIERCIASMRPFVDRAAIYLAGESTDATVAILERLATQPGAPLVVVQGEWRDDFAWARTRSFELVPDADWILWADADDELIGGEFLRDVIAAHPDASAIEFGYRSKMPHDQEVTLIAPRLLRRSAGWRWERALHEVPVCLGASTVALPLEEPPMFVHLRESWWTSVERNIRIARNQGDDVTLGALLRGANLTLDPPDSVACDGCLWRIKNQANPPEIRRTLWESELGLSEGEPMACLRNFDEDAGHVTARVCRGARALQQRAAIRWLLEPWDAIRLFRTPQSVMERYPQYPERQMRTITPLRILAEMLGVTLEQLQVMSPSNDDVLAATPPEVFDPSIASEAVPAPTETELALWNAARGARRAAA